jgi:hypothetical protein
VRAKAWLAVVLLVAPACTSGGDPEALPPAPTVPPSTAVQTIPQEHHEAPFSAPLGPPMEARQVNDPVLLEYSCGPDRHLVAEGETFNSITEATRPPHIEGWKWRAWVHLWNLLAPNWPSLDNLVLGRDELTIGMALNIPALCGEQPSS